MEKILSDYKMDMEQELKSILDFWMTHTVDEINGGFIGRIDYKNEKINEAPKGAVLNARILWSFSAAYNLTGNKMYLHFAKRAFDYICTYFIDREKRGVYWLVDYNGKPLDTKKQIYAQAFTIYAFSEFYKATKDNNAVIEAIDLYDSIIKFSYDNINGGYIEAFTKDWSTSSDLRLSDKDANEKKTMNTHLHLLEAFTALWQIWPYEPVKEKIEELIQNFLQHIIDPVTNNQHLFFDEKWHSKSSIISYGHDIEAAWLLQETAEIINNSDLISKTKLTAVNIANAVKAGFDNDGGLWYEYNTTACHLIKEKHMWPQAEAMVGYLNAYQNTNDKMYLNTSLAAWQFVQQHIHDKKNGEWHWGVKENYESMKEDKVGIWKCPYHNSRACIEIIKRITHLQNNN
jgi:cellobiose epimerase